MATPIETARLAAAINILRPDWPTRSLQTILDRDHTHRPIHDLAVALAWIATDPGTKTPARLAEHGPWWTACTTGSTPTPPKFDHTEWAAMKAEATPMPDGLRDELQTVIANAVIDPDTTRRGIGAHDDLPRMDSTKRAEIIAELDARRHTDPERSTREQRAAEATT